MSLILCEIGESVNKKLPISNCNKCTESCCKKRLSCFVLDGSLIFFSKLQLSPTIMVSFLNTIPKGAYGRSERYVAKERKVEKGVALSLFLYLFGDRSTLLPCFFLPKRKYEYGGRKKTSFSQNRFTKQLVPAVVSTLWFFKRPVMLI